MKKKTNSMFLFLKKQSSEIDIGLMLKFAWFKFVLVENLQFCLGEVKPKDVDHKLGGFYHWYYIY